MYRKEMMEPTKIIIGDCRTEIQNVPDLSIDCIMTSPPYWGLRDYGHQNQIGLEPTPEEYLKNVWGVFDLIKPKLKQVGNLFINLGDTYASNDSAQVKQTMKTTSDCINTEQLVDNGVDSTREAPNGIKPKSLCMIPQRFAWGMIERGWILRNEIIWHKNNHMPESVTDRLTKSHEVIYHFVKQQKYYYDLDAIREQHKTLENRPSGIIRSRTFGYNGKYEGNKLHEDFGSPRARTQRKSDGAVFGTDGMCIKNHSGNTFNHENGKNPGDVWTINTKPYTKAHFAVFPLELVQKPILAGCPVGGMVLDPFGGSGTVAEFCRKNERDCTIIELNEEYKPLIVERSMANIPTLESYTR